MIEPFKYLLQPVALERDEDGRVIREIPGQVLSVYSAEQALRAISMFEAELKSLEGRGNGAGTDAGSDDQLRQPSMSGEPAGSG